MNQTDATADQEPEPVRTSLRGGLRWTAIGQFGAQAVSFASSAALVLFLTPHEFGIIGFAWAVIALLDALVDFGTGNAIVQRRTVSQALLDTAFSINLLFALVAVVGMVTTGFVVSQLTLSEFDSQGTAIVLWQLSASCLVTSFCTMPRCMLQRRLQLAAAAKVQFAQSVVRAALSITLAALGWGVTSLVVGFYASGLVAVVGYQWLARLPLHIRFDPQERRELFRFGTQLTIYNLLNNVLQRADAFLLSGILGQAAYGVFYLARQLLLQPVEMGGIMVRSLLLPKLARLQGRTARARLLYLRSDQVLAGLLLPVLIAAALLIDLLAGSLLKPQWAEVGPVAALLLPAAIASILVQSPGSMLLANGRTNEMLRWGVLRGVVMVAACVSAIWVGLHGMVLVFGALLIMALPGLLAGAAALLRLPVRALLASVGEVLPAAAAAAATLWLVRLGTLSLGLHPLLVVLLAGSACLLAYAAVARFTGAQIAFLAERWLRRHRAR